MWLMVGCASPSRFPLPASQLSSSLEEIVWLGAVLHWRRLAGRVDRRVNRSAYHAERVLEELSGRAGGETDVDTIW